MSEIDTGEITVREITLSEFIWMQVVEHVKIFIRFVKRTGDEMAGDGVKKIKAGDYTFREDLVREMDYSPAETDQSKKLEDREQSELIICFIDDTEVTLHGEEADIAWRKYNEDAR